VRNWIREAHEMKRKEETRVDDDGEGGTWLGRLVTEIGRAARAGWAPTARMMLLLAVAAAAVTLVLMTSR
jgi:hypothetical protein